MNMYALIIILSFLDEKGSFILKDLSEDDCILASIQAEEILKEKYPYVGMTSLCVEMKDLHWQKPGLPLHI